MSFEERFIVDTKPTRIDEVKKMLADIVSEYLHVSNNRIMESSVGNNK